MKCPECDSEAVKVIYWGLPSWLCCNVVCRCLFGVFAGFLHALPFEGWVLVYSKDYIRSLPYWFKEKLRVMRHGRL